MNTSKHRWTIWGLTIAAGIWSPGLTVGIRNEAHAEQTGVAPGLLLTRCETWTPDSHATPVTEQTAGNEVRIAGNGTPNLLWRVAILLTRASVRARRIGSARTFAIRACKTPAIHSWPSCSGTIGTVAAPNRTASPGTTCFLNRFRRTRSTSRPWAWPRRAPRR